MPKFIRFQKQNSDQNLCVLGSQREVVMDVYLSECLGRWIWKWHEHLCVATTRHRARHLSTRTSRSLSLTFYWVGHPTEHPSCYFMM